VRMYVRLYVCVCVRMCGYVLIRVCSNFIVKPRYALFHSFSQRHTHTHTVMAINVVCLPEICTVRQVLRVLRDTRHNGFPIVPHRYAYFRERILSIHTLILTHT